ncbi:hypothetical protein [Acidovorax sp.]|uniref:hypothetical protein n=1 Tax=Acidovorax sp. TaxID=1872122 RepID=UPI0027BA3D5D|nr:hypothetical protein [Acidovorax sp.]
MYSSADIDNLEERTLYETFLLERIFNLERKWTAERHVEEITFWAGGPDVVGERTHTLYADSINFGPAFTEIGMPLLFVTAFKLLDMVIEWGVEANGRRVRHQFEDKLKEWRPSAGLVLPPAMHAEPWLRDVTVALYERLYEYRNTIIHRRTFSTPNGGLHIVREGKTPATPTTEIQISADVLKQLADFAVGLVMVLLGQRALDTFEVMRLKLCADQLSSLHGLSKFGQLRPVHIRMNYLVPPENISDPIDVAALHQLAVRKIPGEEVIQELAVGILNAEGCTVWMLTNAQLMSSPSTIDVEYAREHGVFLALSSEVRRALTQKKHDEQTQK